MRIRILVLVSLVFGSYSIPLHAITGVNPSGVNVRAAGVTTVFLTFQGLLPGQTSVESFWCGEVTTTGVSNTNPCVPGTIFGRLPARNNFSTTSGTGGVSNFTDIMTIPASVARRAYQDARRGNPSNFFYVRRFTGGGADQFVTVTCRLAGGGARTPLALTDVRLRFLDDGQDRPVSLFDGGSTLPPVEARIRYNGSGRLKGRWEVVLPGDPEPSSFDLLTEATLPLEQRGTQRRYTVIGRFDLFLPPTGSALIPGPDSGALPRAADGAYKVLLRVEATEEKEGNSNTNAGVVSTGGVAGFPMPVLRYYIGSGGQRSGRGELALLSPRAGEVFGQQRQFEWLPVAGVEVYNLEVRGTDGTDILTATVRGGSTSYQPPPWFTSSLGGQKARWRVSALNGRGEALATSNWRELRTE